MVKISHAIFALPFALISALYATSGKITLWQSGLVVLCMITARNVAMTFNRLVDATMDAHNPRTAMREIPSGKLSVQFARGFLILNALFFVFFAAQFNRLSLLLSPLALLVVMFYSITKRFTHLTQIFLGLALGIAPPAAWIALTGSLSLFPMVLGLGVFFWAAGFDLIYSTQDYEFDRRQGVKNLVAALGIAKGLWLARVFHMLAMTAFFSLKFVWPHPGLFYLGGTIIMAVVLIWEHTLVKKDDLSKVNQAFFTTNGFVAILMLVATIFDIYGAGGST